MGIMSKNNGKIRVYIDFINLNKAFLMHPHLMPRIYDLVDSTLRHERMCFLDAFFGYTQIPVYGLNKIHT